jgi:hypothetical protein
MPRRSAGTIGNSPRFQPRGRRANAPSPGGTAENPVRAPFLSSLRDLRRMAPIPGVETPGYCRKVPAGTAQHVTSRIFWQRGNLRSAGLRPAATDYIQAASIHFGCVLAGHIAAGPNLGLASRPALRRFCHREQPRKSGWTRAKFRNRVKSSDKLPRGAAEQLGWVAMQHRPQNIWLGRFYWQTAKRWPVLHLLCLSWGLFVGVGCLNLFWDPQPNDRQAVLVRPLGVFMLAGYGWWLGAFVLRLKRGTWKNHCDLRIAECSGPARAAKPRVPLKRFPSFLAALGFSWLCWAWYRVGVAVYHWALVVAKDEGAGFPDGVYIFCFIGWSILAVIFLFVLMWSWRQVWKPTTIKLE